MANKYGDIRWKWLAERGFDVLADRLQYEYMQSLWAPLQTVQGVFCEAPSGTGKTTLAVLAGIYEVESGTYDKLIYVRNAVSIRDQGFLPGGIAEKELPFMRPLIKAMDRAQPGLFEVWSRPDIKTKQPKVEALTTSYIRGDTWENAFVILDEVQSFELDELQATYTRCATSCKIVSCGSLRQIDGKVKRIAGYTPFEIYMKHFEGTPVMFHSLETDYRGWWSKHADNVQETIQRLKNGT